MPMHSMWRRLAAGAAAAMIATPAAALDPFYLSVDLDQGMGFDGNYELRQGFGSVEDTIDALDYRYLQSRTGYDGDQAVNSLMYFRGLDVQLEFPNSFDGYLAFTVRDPNGRTLLFQDFTPRGGNPQVEGLVIEPRFFATTAEARRDTLAQLKEFLKKSGKLSILLTQLARWSPTDPLAGNPDSLFSRRMRGDFDYGFTNKVSQIWGCGTSAFNFTNDAPIQVAAVGGVSDIFAEAQARAAALQAQNELGMGLLASTTTAKVAASGTQPGGELVTNAATLPFSYTVKLDSDPRKKIRFDLPLTYMETEGAVSYSTGFGVAYTHPLTDDWSLTPGVGVGATGSEDLGAAGGVAAGSLTSAYTWLLGGFALSLGNAVGYYESVPIEIGDVKAEADIANTVFTNGVLFTGPNSLIAKNLVMEYSLVDTRITGDEVYADNYQEVGVALGYIRTTMGVIDSYTKLGLSYLVGDGSGGDIESLRLNLTARF
jgi:hypothetical protein